MSVVTPQGPAQAAVTPQAPGPEQTNTNSGDQTSALEETKSTEQSKPDFLSPKFAALAKQQKMLRHQQKQIEAAKQAFEAEKKAQAVELEQFKAWKQRLTQDPYSVMLEAGLTADQAAALMLNQPRPEDQKLSLLQQEIQKLKSSQEESQKRMEEAQTKQYEDAVNQIRSDVTHLINSDSTFETIKAMNAQEAVVELIKQTYEADGKLLTNQEAAQQVEDYLVEEALRLAKLQKIQAKLTPAQVNAQAMETQKSLTTPQQIQKPLTNTLSNRLSQTVGPSNLSERERRERAILAFQGKLSG